MDVETVFDFADGLFGYITDPITDAVRHIRHQWPSIRHPIGFNRCYGRLLETQNARGADERVLWDKALYHTRNRTQFYLESQR